jgi:hypothetical protein
MIDTSGNVSVGSVANNGGKLQVNGNIVPNAVPSSNWGIDFAPSTSANTYVTIANGGTYNIAGGSGLMMIFEQSSNVGIFICTPVYGTVYSILNPQGNYTTTANTGSKTNVYYNGGIGQYVIQNNMGTSYNYWICGIKCRSTP